MQTDVIPDDSRSVKYAFEILYDDENERHNNGMRPVAPLKCGDQHSWYPADDDTNIRNHRQDDHHGADHWRKIQTENCERNADEYAIHQTHE